MHRGAFVLTALSTFALTPGAPLLAQTAPPPSPVPSPQSITDLVSGMIEASRLAAGDVSIEHQYGANLGMPNADIVAFEIQYERLASSANGLLGALAFQIEGKDPVNEAALRAAAATILTNTKALDDSLAQVQAAADAQRKATAGPRGGFDIGKFLSAVFPVISPIVALLSTGADFKKKVDDMAVADRTSMAARIRSNYWMDVAAATGSTGTTGAQPAAK
jgi:hypothetical protein